jgi:hypothetical protein
VLLEELHLQRRQRHKNRQNLTNAQFPIPILIGWELSNEN